VNENDAAVQALKVGQSTTDTFNYTVTDGSLTDTATITITINGANDAPLAGNDTGTATEKGGVANGSGGSNATGSVLTNDTDPDSTLTVASIRTGGTEGAGTAGTLGSGLVGAHGTLTLGSNGNYTYVVNENDAAVQALKAGQTITDTFNYTVTDGSLTDTATLTITINGANDAPVVSAASVDSTGHISFSIADPDSSSFTLNSPAGIAAAFGNPTLGTGSNTLAVPTASGTVISGTLQVSDGAGGTDDVMGVYLGTTNNDTNITVPVAGGLNAVYGFGGNDTIRLANDDFGAGTYIDGGTGTDTILLTNRTTVDFTTGTVAGVENLTGSSGGDTVTMSAKQWAAFSSIDLAGDSPGSDVLNIVVNGAVDISASGGASIADTEAVHVIGSTGADTLTLTGSQLNALITGDTEIDLGGGTDTINLTSTSTDLNGLSNGDLVNVEIISAASAASGVTINLNNQSEAFTIIGSNSADTLTGGSGNDTLTGGKGVDTLSGGSGADKFHYNAPGDAGPGLLNPDHILDFNLGQNDVFEISAAGFGGGLLSGTDASAKFGSSTNNNFGSASERFHFNTATNTLLYDADGNGAGSAAIALAVLENGASVDAAHIKIVA
jgi:VCBS repeat-containing protein